MNKFSSWPSDHLCYVPCLVTSQQLSTIWSKWVLIQALFVICNLNHVGLSQHSGVAGNELILFSQSSPHRLFLEASSSKVCEDQNVVFDPLNVWRQGSVRTQRCSFVRAHRTRRAHWASVSRFVCVCVFAVTGNVNVLLHCWRLRQKFVRLHMYEMCSWWMLSQNSC